MEGDEFEGKEEFVTQAYKDQMAEVRRAEAEEKKRERKAIGIIVNGAFSVVGTGAAAWWGSKNTGWKDEYSACS